MTHTLTLLIAAGRAELERSDGNSGISEELWRVIEAELEEIIQRELQPLTWEELALVWS